MLRAAHRGYEYQDLLAAVRLADLVLGTAAELHIDEKLVPDDRFDDLTTSWAAGLWERCQFKFRDNAGRPLSLATFTSEARNCKLDRLVLSAIADRRSFARAQCLFRLVARDTAPDDNRLIQVMRQVDSPASLISGSATRRYRFDPEQLWPFTATPTGVDSGNDSGDTWAFLRDGAISRDDLVWFCRHFVIELDAPAASFDLTMPDAAEHLILRRMVNDIGAEAYPNEHRSAVDVAAAFISAARAARSGTAKLTRDELIRRAGLRVDFGAVARAHPVVAHLEVSRRSAIEEIVEAAGRAADESVALLLVGPPGAGKSWTAERVLDALRASGWLVAEHYCFLGSADMERDRRVAVESLIGSLLKRIAEADPAVVDSQRPRFAADEQALVAAIEASRTRQPGRRVALLVDGLDHVTRVIGATTGQPDPSRSLAEELGLLQLPLGSVLIVASQPGPHLEPLTRAGAITMPLPPWTREEIAGLAATLGIIATSERREESLVASDDQDGTTAVVDALTKRSAGNPLFATYLCRELLRRPTAAGDPVGILMALPPFDDTLEAYYEHLVRTLGAGKWVVDVVALLDFSVTRGELREIYPELAHRIEEVVDLLEPVLIEKSTQGGIRVYHESFARYLLRSLESEPGAAMARLRQVIAWLEGRGFFADSRAYRYLFPLRVRAGLDSEVVAAVGTDFVAKSVAAGFGAAAISTNLVIAVGSAGRIGDWPAMTRYVELARAAGQYEFDNLGGSVVEFADVALELLGAATFAERLLYDGKTTMPSRPGLQLCAAADRAGAAAPWREYLDAFERDRQTDNTVYGEESDSAVWLAWLRGTLRTLSEPDGQLQGTSIIGVGGTTGSQSPRRRPIRQVDPRRLAAWLERTRLGARDVIETVITTCGPKTAGDLVRLLPGSRRGSHALALAEWLASNEDISADESKSVGSALQWAIEARAVGVPDGSVLRLLNLGIDVADLARDYSRDRLLELSQRVQESEIQYEPSRLYQWLDAVEIAARRDPFGLSAVEGMLLGPGWYRCWLRFAVAVARARVPSVSSVRSEPMDALRLLTQESDPFAGNPRACDLYQIHSVVASTIRQALSSIDTNDWRAALDVLADVSNRVSTTISGELGGPVARDLVLQLVVEFTDAERLLVSQDFIREFVEKGRRGCFYSDIARFALFAARLALAAGDRAQAMSRYAYAMSLLVAYGWHKDVTIYELLGPMPALMAADCGAARVRLSRIQSLCERVVEHTDGKETRYAPDEWWEQLVRADPEVAGWMLLDGLLASPNMPRPRLETAREELWRAQQGRADAIVAAALRLTLDIALDRLDPPLVERLADMVTSETDPIIRRLAEWLISRGDERPSKRMTTITTDDANADRGVLKAINAAGQRLGIAPLGIEPIVPTNRDGVGRARDESLSVENYLRDRVLITYDRGTTALVRGIRQWLRQSYDAREERWNTERFVNAVGYRMLQLYQDGSSDEAATVLWMIADGLRFGDGGRILDPLARGLELRGAESLAVLAHVLAFTRSRGGGGWLTFGDEKHLDSLRRAIALDAQATLALLHREVQRVGGSIGVTRSLVSAFAALDVPATISTTVDARSSGLAFAMWDAAFEVIESRLPRLDQDDAPGQAYTPSEYDLQRGGVDAALAAATVAGLVHPGREQKRRSLLAVCLLMRLRPTLVGRAVGHALSAQLDVLTLTWLLELLAATDLHDLSHFVHEPLRRLAQVPQLRIRSLARSVLRSIGDDVGPLPGSAPEPGLLDAHTERIVGPRIWTPSEHERGLLAGDIEGEDMHSTHGDEDRVRAQAESLVTEVGGARLKRVRAALPGLRPVVVARVAKELTTGRFRRRMRAQLDHLSSRARPQWPDAILVSDETAELAIQEIAAAGRAAFAAEGRLITDPDGWEVSLATALGDDVILAIAVEAARMARPALPISPERGAAEWAIADGEDEHKDLRTWQSVTSSESAPCVQYGGRDWRVIGLVEHKYHHNERYPHDREGKVILTAALEIRPSQDTSGLDAAPLGYGDVRVWDRPHVLPSEELTDRARPLVGMIGGPGIDKGGEWPRIGYAAPFLAPQKALVAALALVPRPDFLGLALHDTHGCGLVFRAWRSLYETSEYELPRPSISGGALLLRTDLFDKFLREAEGRLTWREHLVGINVMAPSGDRDA